MKISRNKFWHDFLTILDAILDLQSWILKIWQQIRIKRPQKNNNVRFYRIFFLFFESWSTILDPPFIILKIWHQIWIQRLQKPVSGQFHWVLNTFQNFDCHIGSAILNFKNLTSDSDSATPKSYVQPLLPIFVGIWEKHPHTYIFSKFSNEKLSFRKW